jgi:hypothetical protein
MPQYDPFIPAPLSRTWTSNRLRIAGSLSWDFIDTDLEGEAVGMNVRILCRYESWTESESLVLRWIQAPPSHVFTIHWITTTKQRLASYEEAISSRGGPLWRRTGRG